MGANIVELIHRQAQIQPDRPAVITDQSVISYSQLCRFIGISTGYLKDQGIAPGQVVGLSMAYIPLHLVTILALAQAGAVSLPLHPAQSKERRLLAAHRFGATRVVSARREFALEGLEFVDLKGLSFDEGSQSRDDAIHPVNAEAPMRIIISSGTSGNPKGMVLTHGTMALRSQTTEAGFASSSRVLPMDLNFIVGFRPAISALTNGAALIFPASLGSEQVLQGMVRHRATHVYFSPVQARAIAARAGQDGTTCPDLVCLRIGGGSVSTDVLQAVQSSLTPNIYVSYGSTESGLVTYATPEMISRHPDTVGQVCPWATVEVVDQEGHPVPPGKTGEIRIRSGHQVSGYYRDEGRNRLHFRDGWFYPGDLVHVDREGLFYFDGRIDEQINLEGVKINPEDIEAMLLSHPAVLDAACFAAPGEEDRDVLVAALVLNDPSRLDEVKAHARQRGNQIVPERYVVTTSLPRTETGKLKRAELVSRLD